MVDGGVAEQIYWFGAGEPNAEQWITRYFVARGPDKWVDVPNNARIRRVRTADYVSYTISYERSAPPRP